MSGSYTAEPNAASSPRKSRLVGCAFSIGLAASLACPTDAMAQSGSRTVPQRSYQPAPTYQAAPSQMVPQGSQTQPMMPQGSQTMVPQGSQARSMAPQGSQTHSMAPSGSQTQPMATQGSGTHNSAMGGSQSHAVAAPVALSGYCPVCVIDMKKWIKGSPQFQTVYDGKTYMFPDENLKQKFLSDPAKYVPAMGGDCTVCKVDMGKDMAGSVHFSSLYKDRLYLFPGDMQKQAFRQNPSKYANADVALNGKCSVCRVELNKDVEGDPQFTSFYEGKRYWFPGKEQQDMFTANPAKYAE